MPARSDPDPESASIQLHEVISDSRTELGPQKPGPQGGCHHPHAASTVGPARQARRDHEGPPLTFAVRSGEGTATCRAGHLRPAVWVNRPADTTQRPSGVVPPVTAPMSVGFHHPPLNVAGMPEEPLVDRTESVAAPQRDSSHSTQHPEAHRYIRRESRRHPAAHIWEDRIQQSRFRLRVSRRTDGEELTFGQSESVWLHSCAPAGDRAVRPQATGVPTSCRNAHERFLWWSGLAEGVVPPAGDRAVVAKST